MNFDDAIKSHSDWKIKLSKYLSNPDGSIAPKTLEKDNVCALGQWIYGEGIKHNNLNEFKELSQAHAEFHKAAADIVNRKIKGENITADLALGASSPYASCSTKVITLLMKIKGMVK